MNAGTINYEHDCCACTFEGNIIWEGQVKDVYTCGQSIIIRHSSDPAQNSSLPRPLIEDFIDKMKGGMFGEALKLVLFNEYVRKLRSA